jgi:hypothetical protein
MKKQTSVQKLPEFWALWVNRGDQKKSERGRNCALTLRGLRRRAFYQPLALAMSVLLLPALSWRENGPGVRPFQASAQTSPQPLPCTPSPRTRSSKSTAPPFHSISEI